MADDASTTDSLARALGGFQHCPHASSAKAELVWCDSVKLSKWLTRYYGTGIGSYDLIDACACAIAARDSTSRLGGDEVDCRGLRMEINY